MSLIYCRHGRTQWNDLGTLQGTFDSPLTDTGKKQAYESGRLAAPHSPQLIYCSELKRARDSAELANLSLCVPVLTSPLLNERCFGALQGLDRTTHPKWWQAYTGRDQQDCMAIPGSEAASAVACRIGAFWTEMREMHGDTRILVVGHGEWLKIALSLAWGLSPWSGAPPLPDNGQVWRLEEMRELMPQQQSA
ncbi:histidine phosphatase family protein [Ferrimonas futtsuensis]|uniref:histidine phosphatase family protein n=1 Tax=Ferrimonas futtsuensis TaxID=364764 RepID=UPI00041328E6|nr:histidine phosphatase family protein [Ferrimonas futtsuensis]